jgi:hypothetical protein
VARRGGAACIRMLAVLAATTLAASACGSPDRAGSQAAGEEPQGATRSESPVEPARPQLLSATARSSGDPGGNNDAPVERLGPVPPTNHTSYTWAAEVQGTTVAASSTRAVRRTASVAATLWTSLPGEDSRGVEAELINETKDRALLVQGHVIYELRGPGGTEHFSEPVDVTLGPGEKVVVEFLLELPSGDYEGSSSFRPA